VTGDARSAISGVLLEWDYGMKLSVSLPDEDVAALHEVRPDDRADVAVRRCTTRDPANAPYVGFPRGL
jgi:hypothetical protein